MSLGRGFGEDCSDVSGVFWVWWLTEVVKIVEWVDLVDTGGYKRTEAFSRVADDIKAGVKATVWPPGTDRFVIYPESGKRRGEGNGVVPIKWGFMAELESRGWKSEVTAWRRKGTGSVPGAFDAHLDFEDGSLPFVVEWETGNISSSHRAINRIGLGILDQRIAGGVVVLPSAKLAPFLTDRIGNFPELVPYIPLWREWRDLRPVGYLGLVVVEQDGESWLVPRIPKGRDGRALL